MQTTHTSSCKPPLTNTLHNPNRCLDDIHHWVSNNSLKLNGQYHPHQYQWSPHPSPHKPGCQAGLNLSNLILPSEERCQIRMQMWCRKAGPCLHQFPHWLLWFSACRSHITPGLLSLHWLPVNQRIIFRCHKRCCSFRSSSPCSLRSGSSNLLAVPQTKLASIRDRVCSSQNWRLMFLSAFSEVLVHTVRALPLT